MGKNYLDLEFGNVEEDIHHLVTEKQHEAGLRYKKQLERRQKLYEKLSSHCGNFYFYRYDKLLEQLKDDTAVGFRFLYLCACADEEGYFIKYNNMYCKTREDFTYIFEKPKNTVCRYIDEMINNNLLFKDDKGYKLNPLFYSTGKLDNEFKRNSVRTFNKAVKELYNNASSKEHAYIGKLLKLAPYVNVYNNILCWDIKETDVNKVNPLTIEEIRGIVHPNNNYSYAVMDKLENLFIKGEPVIGAFNSVGQVQYIINPRLFYRGNNINDLQAIIDHFDISKSQYLKKVKKKKMERKGE